MQLHIGLWFLVVVGCIVQPSGDLQTCRTTQVYVRSFIISETAVDTVNL